MGDMQISWYIIAAVLCVFTIVAHTLLKAAAYLIIIILKEIRNHNDSKQA